MRQYPLKSSILALCLSFMGSYAFCQSEAIDDPLGSLNTHGLCVQQLAGQILVNCRTQFNQVDIASASITHLTIPNGTQPSDAAAFGQLGGSFQAPIQSTSTTLFTTTSNTYQVTHCSATITPTSSSHRVKITLHAMLRNGNLAVANLFYSIDRNGTDLGAASSGGFGRLTSGASTGSFDYTHGMSYIDSPASTSALTYSLTVRNDDGATIMSVGNTGTQIMILEEVQ